MIGSMDLAVTVHTASVEGEEVKSGYGLMTHNNTHVTVLAQLVAVSQQKTFVVGTVRGMACEAVLLYGGMLPQERASHIGVALITSGIG
jgi:hypothetical protein